MFLTCHNSKGGCGKTTTIFNLAAQLHKDKIKFLAIDFDRQQDLTRLFLTEPSKKSFLEILTENENSANIITKSDRYNFLDINILPSSDNLSKIYNELQTNIYNVDRLLQELSFIEKQYDVILIDLSNNLQILEDVIFKISDLIIIPINPGMNVIYDSFRTIQHINMASRNPFGGKNINYKVLLNSFARPYDSNEPADQRKIRESALHQFGDNVFETIVKEYAHFIKSEAVMLPIPYLLKDDQTYRKLLEEIFKTLGIISINKGLKEVNNGKS